MSGEHLTFSLFVRFLTLTQKHQCNLQWTLWTNTESTKTANQSTEWLQGWNKNSSLSSPREWQWLTYPVPALISAFHSRRVSRACACILPAPLPVVEIKDSSQSTIVLCKHDHYHLGHVVQALNKLIQDYQKPFTYKPRREYFVLGFNHTFIFSQVQITWLENLDQRNWNLVCCFISG